MSEEIRLVRNGKGGHFDRQDAGSDVLAVEFVDGEGKRITVMIRRGRVEVSTIDGVLLVQPQAANSLYITTKPI